MWYARLDVNKEEYYDNLQKQINNFILTGLEKRIESHIKMYFIMNDELELYKPKKTWFKQKIYNIKMWWLKKLMGDNNG